MPPFGGNPWWVYLASALPALLVTILIFMDQQITAVIVNRKEHKLKVGDFVFLNNYCRHLAGEGEGCFTGTFDSVPA